MLLKMISHDNGLDDLLTMTNVHSLHAYSTESQRTVASSVTGNFKVNYQDVYCEFVLVQNMVSHTFFYIWNDKNDDC